MGDIPIFVSHDSADVWAKPELFDLDSQGRPLRVAGVPPDYFSQTGQRWGNPLYRWDALSQQGYRWWIERFRMSLFCFDLAKVDHFRGFEAYWEIPAEEPDAVHGRWVTGPGTALFEAVRAALGPIPLVAENLGFITPEVEALRKTLNFPGMAVLQFAFGGDPNNSFLPHNYSRDLVAYTGTHDNDTTVGWWNRENFLGADSLEQFRQEQASVCRYLDTDGQDIHWAFIRAILSSVAGTALIPLQDVLGLGSEARINLPGTDQGNWQWRYVPSEDEEDWKRLAELTKIYGR